MKLRLLNGGRIAVSESVPKYNPEFRLGYGEFLENDPPEMLGYDDGDGDIAIGCEGCLAVSEHPTDEDRAWMSLNLRGIPGNSNPEIRRLHGWRGTSWDAEVNAYGWRRVESIKTYRNGLAWRVVLSADLKPTED